MCALWAFSLKKHTWHDSNQRPTARTGVNNTFRDYIATVPNYHRKTVILKPPTFRWPLFNELVNQATNSTVLAGRSRALIKHALLTNKTWTVRHNKLRKLRRVVSEKVSQRGDAHNIALSEHQEMDETTNSTSENQKQSHTVNNTISKNKIASSGTQP